MSGSRASGLPALLLSAAMETCRLWIMLNLLFLVPGLPPFPFAQTGCTLAAGSLVGRGLSRIRRRRITSVLVYGAGCLAAAWLSAGSYSGVSFWFVSCSAILFWLRGVYIGARPLSHSLTINRYDAGIGILFCVYFLRMGLQTPDPLAPRLIGAYFLFSILALFSSRCLSGDSGFISARPAAALLLPFAAAFFLAALALVLLYPLLARAAGDAYAFARDHSGPIMDLLVAILRFLFARGRGGPAAEASAPVQAGDDPIAITEVSPPGIAEKVFLWIFIIIAAAAALVLIVWIVVALARYLAGNAGTGEGKPGLFAALRDLLTRAVRGLRKKLRGLRRLLAGIRRRRPAGAGQEAFRGLCAWGRASGLPRRRDETPAEYLRRVTENFPAVQEAAQVLVRGLHTELYARKELRAADIALLHGARRRLSSPALIPARLARRLGLRRRKGK